MAPALPAERTIRFRNGDVELDGRIFVPGDGWPLGCVVCHPHPLYGGNMHNNVVVAITAALAARGIATLRFDFRGVGASGGTHGGGEAEIGDARAAVRALATEIGARSLVIAGYSFGSVVALRAAAASEHDDVRVESVAAIAPPVAMFDPSFVAQISGDLLFVAGDRDEYCPRERFEALEGPGNEEGVVCAWNSTRRVLIPGADHFLSGFEEIVGDTVARWLKPDADDE